MYQPLPAPLRLARRRAVQLGVFNVDHGIASPLVVPSTLAGASVISPRPTPIHHFDLLRIACQKVLTVGAMGEVPLVSQGERCPSARGTEALQSCFCRPGLYSMTTGRRESCRKELHRMRRRCGRTSFGPSASRVRLGRKSGVCMAVLFAVGAKGSHNQKPPPGQPRPPPSHCLPARCGAAVAPLWRGYGAAMARHGAAYCP